MTISAAVMNSETSSGRRTPPRWTGRCGRARGLAHYACTGGVGYRDANPAPKNQPRLARDLDRQERAGTEETHGSAVVFEATVCAVVACGGQEQQDTADFAQIFTAIVTAIFIFG